MLSSLLRSGSATPHAPPARWKLYGRSPLYQIPNDITREPWLKQLELIRASFRLMFGGEGSQREIENGKAPLAVEPSIGRLSLGAGTINARRYIRAGDKGYVFRLRPALCRAEAVPGVGEVVLHCAEQVGAEPALLHLGARKPASRKQPREKLLRKIARGAKIVRSAAGVNVNGRSQRHTNPPAPRLPAWIHSARTAPASIA
jgi:hypothetical protein